MSEKLNKLRKQIDDIDANIIECLNTRAKVSCEIGKTKEGSGENFYKPSREEELMKRWTSLNKGPLPNDALKAIFREILSVSRALQKELVIAYLGHGCAAVGRGPGTLLRHRHAERPRRDAHTKPAQRGAACPLLPQRRDFGMSTPTSMTLVETRMFVSPRSNLAIAAPRSGDFWRPWTRSTLKSWKAFAIRSADSTAARRSIFSLSSTRG